MSGISSASTVTGAPTLITGVQQTGLTANVFTYIQAETGAQVTAAETSATLQTSITKTGSGVFTFLQLFSSTGTSAVPAKLKITIDGLVVSDETIASLAANEVFSVIGSYFSDAAGMTMSEVSMPYSRSFLVEIAGDGTNGVQVAHRNYET